jgi:hypothetical protein
MPCLVLWKAMQRTALHRSCYEYYRGEARLFFDAGYGAPQDSALCCELQLRQQRVRPSAPLSKLQSDLADLAAPLRKLPSSVSSTSGMYHSRTADLVISRVSVSLQNAFKLSQEPFRSIPSTTQAKVEHHGSSGRLYSHSWRLAKLSSPRAKRVTP